MTVPQVLHPFAAPTKAADDFLEIVRAEGCRLWDDEGRTYLDGTASLWYCAVGHGRDEIIDAVHEQMGELVAYHTFGRFTNPPAQRLADDADGARADRRRPGAVHQQRLGGGRQRDEARPCRAPRQRRRRAYDLPQPPLRLPRRDVRRHLARRPAAEPDRRSGRCCPTPFRSRTTASQAMRRRGHLPRPGADRGDHRRAGDRRRRRVPAGRWLPAGAAGPVRRVRRGADLRRGDHRLRAPRLLVRQPPLRRRSRT